MGFSIFLIFYGLIYNIYTTMREPDLEKFTRDTFQKKIVI